MTLWLMYAKKPTKIYGKNLWQKPLKICDKNPYITKTFQGMAQAMADQWTKNLL